MSETPQPCPRCHDTKPDMHREECWREHLACAVREVEWAREEIRRLNHENAALEREAQRSAEKLAQLVFPCGPNSLHPYKCDGPGRCPHCDRRHVVDGGRVLHDPTACALCDDDNTGAAANPRTGGGKPHRETDPSGTP